LILAIQLKLKYQNLGNYQRTNGNLLYINSLNFANPTKGYAVGEYGMILKNTTGLDDLSVNVADKKSESTIYPNPASEKISIFLPENIDSTFQIEIFNNIGKIVFSQSYQSKNDIEITTRNFSKGVYFVSITSNDKKSNS